MQLGRSRANAARIGGWPVSFGAGTDFNFAQFRDAGGASSFAADYFGRGSTVGTSDTVPLDPLFVAPASVTGSGPGAGDGNYRLQAGSPCKSKNLGRIYVPFDADGVARGTTTSQGAFV